MQTIILFTIFVSVIAFCVWFSSKQVKKKMPIFDYLPIATSDLSPDEVEFIRLINEHRINKGLNVLIPEKLACEVCDIQNLYDIQNDIETNHDNWYKLIQNAKCNEGDHICGAYYITPQALFNDYLRSTKGHKEAIENKDRTHIGTSIMKYRNHTILLKYKHG